MPEPSVVLRDVDSLTAQLAVVLPTMQQALDRRMASEFPHPERSKTQLALLRVVGERDGITVRESAEALLMQPNNVSALVSQLSAAGLLRRVQDADDKRVAHLHLTAEARRRIDTAAELTGRFLAEGLQPLTDGELAAIGSALGALRSLAGNLHPTR